MTARETLKRCPHGGDRKSENIKVQPCTLNSTKGIAETFGVSERTIKKQNFVDNHETQSRKF